MTFDEFYNQYINQRIDIDNANGYQCVDIPKAYGKNVWGIDFSPIGYSGGAKDIIKPNAIWKDSDVTRVLNTPNGIPPKGAVLVFDASIFNWVGHTGVVTNADANTVTIIEQNGGAGKGIGLGPDAIREKTYKYTWNSTGVGKVLGWIIPNNGQLVGIQQVQPKAWENSRGPEQQERFAYINQNNDLYCSWVASGKCDKEVADTLADRDQEIKDFKDKLGI